MKRSDYKNYVWYPIKNEGDYWVEKFPNEFPNCNTIVRCRAPYNNYPEVETRENCKTGWGTMAKYGCFDFMIIDNSIR